MADLFGLPVSQGGLMNMLRRAEVVASDETGVRIEGNTGPLLTGPAPSHPASRLRITITQSALGKDLHGQAARAMLR